MNRAAKVILALRGLPNTLLFNFRYFPWRVALRLPVLVSHRVWLMKLAGEVRLGHVRTGIVRIGFGEIGIFDRQRSRSIWQVSGRVEFGGRADIGHGSKICVSGRLVIGDAVNISAESAIVASHKVCIGDGSLISWDVLIMDSDLHPLYDRSGVRINEAIPVLIGKSVWIGCRALILKGVRIADGVVIAAATTLRRSVNASHVVAGGAPPRILREGVRWMP